MLFKQFAAQDTDCQMQIESRPGAHSPAGVRTPSREAEFAVGQRESRRIKRLPWPGEFPRQSAGGAIAIFAANCEFAFPAN